MHIFGLWKAQACYIGPSFASYVLISVLLIIQIKTICHGLQAFHFVQRSE